MEIIKVSRQIIPLNVKILMRKKLQIKKFPIGVDPYGNLYYEDNMLRRVEKPHNYYSIDFPLVDERYSKWLTYKTDQFPVYEKKIMCILHDIFVRTQRLRLKNINNNTPDAQMVYRLALNQLDREKLFYNPCLETFQTSHLRKNINNFCI